MPVMLQVRNLPDEVHKRLKERAAEERMSLSDYVARELAGLVAYRSNAEIMADFHRRHPELKGRFEPGFGAETIRAVRDEREAELEARHRDRHGAP